MHVSAASLPREHNLLAACLPFLSLSSSPLSFSLSFLVFAASLRLRLTEYLRATCQGSNIFPFLSPSSCASDYISLSIDFSLSRVRLLLFSFSSTSPSSSFPPLAPLHLPISKDRITLPPPPLNLSPPPPFVPKANCALLGCPRQHHQNISRPISFFFHRAQRRVSFYACQSRAQTSAVCEEVGPPSLPRLRFAVCGRDHSQLPRSWRLKGGTHPRWLTRRPRNARGNPPGGCTRSSSKSSGHAPVTNNRDKDCANRGSGTFFGFSLC